MVLEARNTHHSNYQICILFWSFLLSNNMHSNPISLQLLSHIYLTKLLQRFDYTQYYYHLSKMTHPCHPYLQITHILEEKIKKQTESFNIMWQMSEISMHRATWKHSKKGGGLIPFPAKGRGYQKVSQKKAASNESWWTQPNVPRYSKKMFQMQKHVDKQ